MSGQSLDNFENQFVAGFLSGRCAELAAEAATRLLERHPDVEARYRPVPQLKWRENLAARLADLSACISAGAPELFGSQISWSKAAFAARQVPVEDLARSLQVLNEVLSRQLPPADSKVIEPYFAAATLALRSEALPEAITLSPGTPEGEVAARYLLAILEGDRLAASEVVLDAARAIPVRRIYTHVLVPVQCELGRLWHACELNVAEEHFATATTAMVMAQLQPHAVRKPRDGRCLLAVCVEGDMHDLGVRMLADFFEMDGWRVVCLGASVPSGDIAAAADFFHAHLVAISASLPTHLERVHETIELLKESSSPPRTMLGGHVFRTVPHLWQSLGADGYAESAEEALSVADKLVPPPAH